AAPVPRVPPCNRLSFQAIDNPVAGTCQSLCCGSTQSIDGTDCAMANYSSLAIRLRTCRRGKLTIFWTPGYRWMWPVTHLPYALADRHAHQRLSFISAPPTAGRASCGLRHTRIGQGLQLTRSAGRSRDDQQPHGSD